MIISLEGKLTESNALTAIVEVQGIGYEVHVPLCTVEQLPPIGKNVRLHTFAVYREDAQNLYGFTSREERNFFKLIVEKVSGVGPKVALGLFSKLSLSSLHAALLSGDTTLLSKCPGIGKKTAERLVVELKDKVGPTLGSTSSPLFENAGSATSNSSSKEQDAIAALLALGYKKNEADRSVRQALSKLGSEATTESLIKYALN